MSIENSDLQLLEKHTELFERVCDSISNAPAKNYAYIKSISDNVANLREEIKGAPARDLPSLFYQLNLQITLGQKVSTNELVPDINSPYFGHMEIEVSGKKRDILLGHTSFNDPTRRVSVVDWKKTPIASIYYDYSVGEEFELDLPERSIEGVLLSKSIITIIQNRLLRIDGDKSFVFQKNAWIELDVEEEELSGGAGVATRELTLGTGRTGFISPDIVSLLDKEQFSIVNNATRDPLLLIGGAGSGKTTVALHRIATICKKAKVHPNNVLVVVPHMGLIKLSNRLLGEIGLSRVQVQTNSMFMELSARSMFHDIPRKVNFDCPVGISLFKRHESLLEILKLYLVKREEQVISELSKLSPNAELARKYKRLPEKYILRKLEVLINSREVNPIQRMKIKDMVKSLFDLNSMRLAIFSDKELLLKAVDISGRVITERNVEDTVMHTSIQMRFSDENEVHIGLDGKNVDDGTSFSLNGTIDEEDFSIMICLLQMISGKFMTSKGRMKLRSHIVLDEAQELTPVEQTIFKNLLLPNGSITVAGDSAQQIDRTISFSGWGDLMARLGFKGTKVKELNVSYRSPQSIIGFAHKVLGPLAPKSPPEARKQGRPIKFTQAQHNEHASMIMYDTLLQLTQKEPDASIAIICNQTSRAEEIHRDLKDIGNVRLIEHSEFEFSPGIDVTTIEQIRGLEFDYVVVPDGDIVNYPDNGTSRKRLHLVVTRAIHQLWIISPNRQSPIINL